MLAANALEAVAPPCRLMRLDGMERGLPESRARAPLAFGEAGCASGPSRLQAMQNAYPGALIVSYRADQEVIGEGDRAESYFEVIDGLFRAVKFTRDGRRQVSAFYGPGDLFGLDVNPAYETTVEAVCVGSVAIFSRARVHSVAPSDPRLAMNLFRGASAALSRTVEHMTMIGRSSAIERVAWFLADIAERFGRRRPNNVVQCTLAMARKDIADYLGLTIETVSRTLAQLKQSRVIALRSAREVEIHNPDLLRRLAAADRDDDGVRRFLK